MRRFATLMTALCALSVVSLAYLGVRSGQVERRIIACEHLVLRSVERVDVGGRLISASKDDAQELHGIRRGAMLSGGLLVIFLILRIAIAKLKSEKGG